jgi:peptide/nickel transport system substrate-binding protein
MKSRTLLVIGAILTTLFVLPATAAEIKKGGTLTYTFQPEPTALSTIATTAVPVAIASTKIFESLLEYSGKELTPKPGVAESWTVSPDQMVYTFKLRPGVKWQDGEPFTSADVKFSIESIIIPYHARSKIYFGQLASVDAPDPGTVIFKLKKPVPFFLKAFQPTEAPMFPAHILASTDLTKFRQSDFMQHPIGTGPFQLKEWKKGSYIVLERNPHYWKEGHPYLDQIVMKVIPDDNGRVVALQNGEIDLAPMNTIPASSVTLLQKNPNLVISHDGSEALGPVAGLIVNLQQKPLSDLKVRQAISLALDRKKITDVIFFGQGTPATNPIIKANSIYYDPKLAEYPFDPAKAKSLLDEAGYPVKPDGHRFTLNYAGLPYGSSWERLGEYVRLALGNVGIEVKLQNQDMGSWLKRVYSDWDYDLASTFLHNYADPSIVMEQEFASSAIQKGGTFNNAMNYRNPSLDTLLQAAGVETNLDKRRNMYFEAEQILHDDMPEIFLMDMYYTTIWNKRVHDLITNGVSMYSNWDSVWVE